MTPQASVLLVPVSGPAVLYGTHYSGHTIIGYLHSQEHSPKQ